MIQKRKRLLHSSAVLPISRDHISISDLEGFLPPVKAANALSTLDTDGDGKISMADMRDAVVSIYHERTNLASTLKVEASCHLLAHIHSFQDLSSDQLAGFSDRSKTA